MKITLKRFEYREYAPVAILALLLGVAYFTVAGFDRPQIYLNILKNASYSGMGNRVKNVSFTLHHGEVLGIAGLVGAGRSELVETIFGIRKKSAGEILIGGKKVEISHPHQAIAYKIALVTEDRKLTGLNLSGTVTENITLAHLPVLFPNGLVNHREEHKIAERYIRQLDIKTPSPAQMVGNLSGGNQQKVVLAKWLLTEPDIIIMDEPTRGIDVGAKRDIYLLIGEMVKAGKAVIVISSEIPEVMPCLSEMTVLP